MHDELRETFGFTSVNVESPPDKEGLGLIDRVDKWFFLRSHRIRWLEGSG